MLTCAGGHTWRTPAWPTAPPKSASSPIATARAFIYFCICGDMPYSACASTAGESESDVETCSIRQHTSASVSMRQHTSAYVRIRQHTQQESRKATLKPAAYVSICQHMSAYVSIRPHTLQESRKRRGNLCLGDLLFAAYVSIRQHTTAYVSIRQHTSA
jgi:hypothetical protein